MGKLKPMRWELWTSKNNPYGSKNKYISQFSNKKSALKYIKRNKPVKYTLKKLKAIRGKK